jgi:ribosomal protein S18 acetylase RimI-like enzyme
MQLAVDRQFRRRGIGGRILSALSPSEPLKVNNIDEKLTGTLAFFEANKFKIILKQYEMSKGL